MGSIQQQLQIYHIGGIVCFIILILSVLLAILLFFLFDIPTIFMIRTGHMKKASVQKITENNARTDPLRKDLDMDYTTANMSDTEQLGPAGGSDDTTLLEDLDRTEQLMTAEVLAPPDENVSAEETPDGNNAQAQTPDQAEPVPETGAEPDNEDFLISENIVVIHTDESI